jgi:hypothetical protein
MGIIVEDGTGLANANSYASAAEAKSYHADRGNSTWALAESAVQTSALIKATSYVDGRYFGQFLGMYPKQSTQALQWPRVDAVDWRGYAITGIVQALKNAVFEAALLFLSEDLNASQERGGMVKKVKVGPVEQEYSDSAPARTTYPAIDQAIRPLLCRSNGNIRVTR